MAAGGRSDTQGMEVRRAWISAQHNAVGIIGIVIRNGAGGIGELPRGPMTVIEKIALADQSGLGYDASPMVYDNVGGAPMAGRSSSTCAKPVGLKESTRNILLESTSGTPSTAMAESARTRIPL